MKKLIYFFLFFYFLNICYSAVPLSAIWKKAKENADKELKSKKLKSLSSIINFDGKLAAELDKYDRFCYECSQLKLQDVLKNTKWHQSYLAFLRSRFGEENWELYFWKDKGYESDNETVRANSLRKIYKDYITASGQKQFNTGTKLSVLWAEMNKKKFYVTKSQAKEIMFVTKDQALNNMANINFGEYTIYLKQPYRDKITQIIESYQDKIQDKMKDEKMKSAQKILLDALEAVKKNL